MAKKTAKAQRPKALRGVSLAFRELADGRRSVSLMYRLDGKQHKVSTGLYLLPETTIGNKHANLDTMVKAEAERQKMVQQLKAATEGAAILAAQQRKAMTIQQLLEAQAQEADKEATEKFKRIGGNAEAAGNLLRSGRVNSKNGKILRAVASHLTAFKNGEETPISRITTDFCEGFYIYLRKTALKASSVNIYYTFLSSALQKEADKRGGLFSLNPARNIAKGVKVKAQESGEIKYLEEAELRRLIDCDYKADDENFVNRVRRPFLFACFCGLRVSDVETLTWGNIQFLPDGGARLRKSLIKTSKVYADDVLDVLLNTQAVRYIGAMPEGAKPADKVFLVYSREFYHKELNRWAEAAGLGKKISSHWARHTFATMMLSHGLPMEQVMKMLGHKSMTMTMRYAELTKKAQAENIAAINESLTMFN